MKATTFTSIRCIHIRRLCCRQCPFPIRELRCSGSVLCSKEIFRARSIRQADVTSGRGALLHSRYALSRSPSCATWVLVTWFPVTSRAKDLSRKSQGAGREAGPYSCRDQLGRDVVGKPENQRITQEKPLLATCKPRVFGAGGFVDRGRAGYLTAIMANQEEQWKNLRRR